MPSTQAGGPPIRTIGARICAALVCSLCLLSAGCSQWHYEIGEPLNAQALPEPDSGFSLGQALDLLGPPHRLSASDSGYVMAWEYWRVLENSLGFNLGPLGIEFMSADWANVTTVGEFLLLSFDRNDTMSAASYASWNHQVADGVSFQPFGAIDLVATSDLIAGFPQHRFGAGLLKRLPEALNAGSDLDSGQHGLEQRGTPHALGQRSLEFR